MRSGDLPAFLSLNCLLNGIYSLQLFCSNSAQFSEILPLFTLPLFDGKTEGRTDRQTRWWKCENASKNIVAEKLTVPGMDVSWLVISEDCICGTWDIADSGSRMDEAVIVDWEGEFWKEEKKNNGQMRDGEDVLEIDKANPIKTDLRLRWERNWC